MLDSRGHNINNLLTDLNSVCHSFNRISLLKEICDAIMVKLRIGWLIYFFMQQVTLWIWQKICKMALWDKTEGHTVSSVSFLYIQEKHRCCSSYVAGWITALNKPWNSSFHCTLVHYFSSTFKWFSGFCRMYNPELWNSPWLEMTSVPSQPGCHYVLMMFNNRASLTSCPQIQKHSCNYFMNCTFWKTFLLLSISPTPLLSQMCSLSPYILHNSYFDLRGQ